MTSLEHRNPLKAILNIRRAELPFAIPMFLYFFFVITSFWILKPIKKALFIGYYKEHSFHLLGADLLGSQAELLAKVLNMVVAFLAVVAFSWLARRYQRHKLTYIFSAFVIAGFIFYAWMLPDPGSGTIWSFYLYGDLYNTLMVAGFFAFLNDSVTPDAARRMYGLIVLGGVAGGAFGSTFVRVWVEQMDPSTWMWVCLGMAVLILVVARAAGVQLHRNPPRTPSAEKDADSNAVGPEIAQPPMEGERIHGGNPAVEGAKLVFQSRYLLAIVVIVGLYEVVSTLMDFQFTATVEHYLQGEALGRQFATVYAITNITSLVVQLVFTSLIMSRFRLTVALLVLPLAIFGASSAFLAFPLLWFGSALSTTDNALNYSLNQSAKEALYTVTSRDEKYKAKAFIDMFVQRFAKVLAVGVSLLSTLIFSEFSTIRWLSLLTIALVFFWIYAAHYAGKRFHIKSDAGHQHRKATGGTGV